MDLKSTIILFGYGTSEGVTKSWDTRGRGRHTEESYGFVSPNVEENLTYEQALARLNSSEHQQATQMARQLVGRLFGPAATVTDAIGDWKDGAENSAVVETSAKDKETLDYAMATLGKALNQKMILSFSHDEKGNDALVTIRTGMDMNTARNALVAAGIENRTLVPSQSGTTVHIYDQGMKLGGKIDTVNRQLAGKIEVASGTGSFIGGDTREQGQAEFDKVISLYRKTHQVRASGDQRHVQGKRSGIGWRGSEAARKQTRQKRKVTWR